ncbi:MAG: hypothetical protein ACRDPE_21160, partial [Solirubrobacterales bacterium]
MRIRWRGVARVAAVVVVGLVALRLVPTLLHAPEPPPLGRDVGLPKAEPAPRVPKPKAKPTVHPKPPKPPRRSVPDAPAATAKIATRTRHHRPHKHSSPPAEPVEPTPP